nr:STAS domain-containing protein [uncultured Peptostreptococcus sp.]
MSLNIKSNYENNSNEWVFSLNGELDLSTANKLKDNLYKSVEEKLSDVVIDMTNLEYIDSTGIGVLVGLMKKLRTQGKDIKISNAKDNVKRIFKITGIDQIISMEG